MTNVHIDYYLDYLSAPLLQELWRDAYRFRQCQGCGLPRGCRGLSSGSDDALQFIADLIEESYRS